MNPRPDDLAYLASSLLADETPPPRVHDAWRRNAAEDEIRPMINPFRGRAGSVAVFAAAAALSIIAAAGSSLPTSTPSFGEERGASASESAMSDSGASESEGGEAAPDVEVELASVAPAIGGAMGERDISALRDPAALGECLAAHGESEAALLGAAPVVVDGRVRQLFVLISGIPGQVSVLVVSEDCGSDPGPPLVHDTIGAPR